MSSVMKGAAVGALAGLAIPVAGISGLATAGLGLSMLLALFDVGPAKMPYASLWQLLTSGTMLALVIAGAIFAVSFRFLAKLQLKSKALVAKINASEGLALDAGHLLGYPSPGFLVFDPQNRKVAVCSLIDDSYRIHDYAWVISWQVTWRESQSMEMGGGTRKVNATGMSVPTFERTVQLKDFAIELTVADPNQPLLKFPMSRKATHVWTARLAAFFN
ncbi:hypothetical protein ACNFIC_14695 [Pseudomonas sp. NY15463]|uniref:hypothetical protein n=1 Tax=Pseudomonas sp. NY15463 TaxID=3400361 RepID=UPI003A83A511